MQITDKQLAVYLAVTFGAAWACQTVAIVCPGNAFAFQGILALSMFAPLFGVAVACMGLSPEKSGIGWRPAIKGRVGLLFAALFVPTLFMLAGAVVVFALFPDQLDLGMPVIVAQVESLGVPVTDGTADGMPLAAVMAVQAAQAALVAPFLNMFFAVGEEAGWRSFMTPALQQRLGHRRGIVVSGVIWGAWHWPANVLRGV
jgi:membrane protease YdiL (CAAX protease family)